MDDFYAARSAIFTPLPWKTFAPPFSDPVDGRNEFQSRICNTAAHNAHFLAATLGLQFFDCNSCNSFEKHFDSNVQGGIEHPLFLNVDILATKIPPYGGAVRVWVGSFYSGAVERNAEAQEPEANPKSGDLELWDSWIAFSNATSNASSEISEGIESAFKSFFATFIEARR